MRTWIAAALVMALVAGACARGIGKENVEFIRPSMGGEDFAYYLEKVPGSFFRLGCRNEEKGIVNPFHSSRFDIDEEVLPGTGVDAVFDSVGRTTFAKSLNCLRPRGYLVFFGQAGGAVPPIDPLALSARGSLFMTRATLTHYTATREELLWRANDVLNAVMQGKLTVHIHRILPLAEARRAHELLESRQTTGKLLLRP